MKEKQTRRSIRGSLIIIALTLLLLITTFVFAWDNLVRDKKVDIPIGDPIVLTLENGTTEANKKLIPIGAVADINDTYEITYIFQVKLDNPKDLVVDVALDIDNPDASLFNITSNFDLIKDDLVEGLGVYVDLVVNISFIDTLDSNTDFTNVIGTLQEVTITVTVLP